MITKNISETLRTKEMSSKVTLITLARRSQPIPKITLINIRSILMKSIDSEMRFSNLSYIRPKESKTIWTKWTPTTKNITKRYKQKSRKLMIFKRRTPVDHSKRIRRTKENSTTSKTSMPLFFRNSMRLTLLKNAKWMKINPDGSANTSKPWKLQEINLMRRWKELRKKLKPSVIILMLSFQTLLLSIRQRLTTLNKQLHKTWTALMTSLKKSVIILMRRWKELWITTVKH
jgi:hypothetical protein